jgi:hypothetical protein
VKVVGMLPAFYTRILSARYGKDALDVYHERSECQSGQKILEDHNAVVGKGGRRLCSECLKYGPV